MPPVANLAPRGPTVAFNFKPIYPRVFLLGLVAACEYLLLSESSLSPFICVLAWSINSRELDLPDEDLLLAVSIPSPFIFAACYFNGCVTECSPAFSSKLRPMYSRLSLVLSQKQRAVWSIF